MKKKLLDVCDRIQEDLKLENPSLQAILEKDMQVEAKFEQLGQSLSGEALEKYLVVKHDLDLIRRYARVASLKLASNEGGVSLEQELTQVRELAEKSVDYDTAMVEIERNAHKHTGRVSDVIKSLFMWKQTPEEHLDSK